MHFMDTNNFFQGMFSRDYSMQYAQKPIWALKQYVPYNLK